MSYDFAQDTVLATVPEMDGYKVLGPSVIYDRIGQGGMGTVYRGKHLNLDIDVAVKCLKRRLAIDDDEFIVRFQREAKLSASITDAHLIRVFDVGHDCGLHYLIMEFVEGETIRERVLRKGPLGLSEALAIIIRSARGIAAAHRAGVVHRDIKPDNILISAQGDVKVTDLGLAKAAESMDSLATATHIVMGTPQYMPPEQFEDTSKVGPAGDVYALAASLYFLLTGKDAIAAGSLTEVMRRVCFVDFPDIRAHARDLPDDLVEIIEESTRKDPALRPTTAREFGARLMAILKRQPDKPRLADPRTGLQGEEGTVVSPPPQRALSRISVAVKQGRLSSRQSAPAVDKETPAKDLPAASVATRRRIPRMSRRSLVIGAVLMVLVGGAVAGLLLNRGENPPSEDSDFPRDRNKELGEERIGDGEKSSDGTVTDPLADAKAKAAELGESAASYLAAGRVREAYAEARAARDAFDGPVEQALLASLRPRLEEYIAKNIELDEPTPDSVVESQPFEVRGRVLYPDVASVRVSGREASFQGGVYSCRLTSPEGSRNLTVVVTDTFGVAAQRSFHITVKSKAVVDTKNLTDSGTKDGDEEQPSPIPDPPPRPKKSREELASDARDRIRLALRRGDSRARTLYRDYLASFGSPDVSTKARLEEALKVLPVKAGDRFVIEDPGGLVDLSYVGVPARGGIALHRSHEASVLLVLDLVRARAIATAARGRTRAAGDQIVQLKPTGKSTIVRSVRSIRSQMGDRTRPSVKSFRQAAWFVGEDFAVIGNSAFRHTEDVWVKLPKDLGASKNDWINDIRTRSLEDSSIQARVRSFESGKTRTVAWLDDAQEGRVSIFILKQNASRQKRRFSFAELGRRSVAILAPQPSGVAPFDVVILGKSRSTLLFVDDQRIPRIFATTSSDQLDERASGKSVAEGLTLGSVFRFEADGDEQREYFALAKNDETGDHELVVLLEQ